MRLKWIPRTKCTAGSTRFLAKIKVEVDWPYPSIFFWLRNKKENAVRCRWGDFFFFFFIIRPRRDRSSTPRRSRRRDSNLTVYTLRIHSLGNGPTQTKMICILLKCGFFSLRNRHTKSKSNSTIVLMVSAFPGNRYDYSSPYFTSLPYLDLKDRTGCYLMD